MTCHMYLRYDILEFRRKIVTTVDSSCRVPTDVIYLLFISLVFWIPVTAAPEFIVLIPPMASTFVYNSVENFWSFVSTLSNFRPYKRRYRTCDADKVNGAPAAVARRSHRTHQKDCPEGQKTAVGRDRIRGTMWYPVARKPYTYAYYIVSLKSQ